MIRLTALGDVVLVEPVVRAFRARFPGVKVDLITEAHHAPLMAARGGLDAVVAYDRHGADAGWSGQGHVLDRLPTRRYDAVVDLQGKLRTRLLSLRVSAKQRITLTKRTFLRGLLSLFGWDPPVVDRHAVEVYLDALAPLGVGRSLPDGDAPKLLADRVPSPGAVRVGFGVGARHATKRWPADRFAALADQLAARVPELVVHLIGGPGDVPLLDAVRSGIERAKIDETDITAMDVAGLADAIQGLDLLVGVDSGPAHLAAAMGVPVVTLFGPTPPTRWGPRAAHGAVVRLDLDCSPCTNFGGPTCPRSDRDNACMRELEVGQVLEGVLDKLPRAREGAR